MSPLTPEEFQAQMQRLGKTYGEKNFANERQKLIWRFVKDIPANAFKSLVDRILEQERYAPMPKTFKEAAWKIKADLGIESPAWPKKTKPSKEAECHWCGDSGNLFIETKPKFKFEHASIRCDCKVGRNGPDYWGPTWNSNYAKNWFRIAIYPSGHGDWSPNTSETMKEKIETMFDAMKAHESNQKSKKQTGDLVSFAELFNGVGK